MVTKLAFGLGLALTIAQPAAAASPLKIDIYNPGDKGVFAVSSEIIYGATEAALVDAQFAASDAKALVERIKATGKTLTTIYISHSDPDYYFGLDTLKEAFPNAKILATPQTIAAIQASKDGKLGYWGPILKENAPKSLIVPEPLRGDTLKVDGQKLKIIGLDGPSPDRTFIWIPSRKAVVGGIPVVANEHVWIADTQTPQSRTNWRTTLKRIEALKPRLVVPGHFSLNPDGTQPMTVASVRFTHQYLDAFEIEALKAANSTALIAAMQRRYPNLEGYSSLQVSAKVIKGEMQWPAN